MGYPCNYALMCCTYCVLHSINRPSDAILLLSRTDSVAADDACCMPRLLAPPCSWGWTIAMRGLAARTVFCLVCLVSKGSPSSVTHAHCLGNAGLACFCCCCCLYASLQLLITSLQLPASSLAVVDHQCVCLPASLLLDSGLLSFCPVCRRLLRTGPASSGI